ncbi:hypothetical protein PVK06_043526 [Gossypium arboreum]|uniref:Uncharacterized protein n=1 Tax=Gossypium arboreum TaxID=29729 RepID=A0ABR0MP17_GOSAR|nr:hypothetical protein PVK06_043526 [Gossypium arboreum]
MHLLLLESEKKLDNNCTKSYRLVMAEKSESDGRSRGDGDAAGRPLGVFNGTRSLQ